MVKDAEQRRRRLHSQRRGRGQAGRRSGHRRLVRRIVEAIGWPSGEEDTTVGRETVVVAVVQGTGSERSEEANTAEGRRQRQHHSVDNNGFQADCS